MKRTNIGIFTFKTYFSDIKKHRVIIFLLFVFIAGLFCGTFCLKSSYQNFSASLAQYLTGTLMKRQNFSIFKTFCSSLVSLFPFLIILFIFGSSPVGPAIVPLTVFLRSSGIGILFAYLYKTYELKGIAFSFLILMPVFLISSFLFLVAGCEAFKFSCGLFRILLGRGESVGVFADYRLYSSRFLIFLIFLLLSSFVDSVFSACFINFFAF